MPKFIASLAGGMLMGALALSVAPATLSASTLSGAYLAAVQADYRDDYVASAEYYDRALRADPDNFALLQNALVARIASGDMATAKGIADRLVALQPDNQVAALVRVAVAVQAGDFNAAEAAMKQAGDGFNALLGGLISGWIEVGRENFGAAQTRFDAMNANEALAAYGQYHKALALAMAGDFVSAEAILAGKDKGPLHLNRAGLIAHAEILAQLGREADAVTLLNQAIDNGFPDATLIALRDRMAAGEEVPFDQVTEAKDGVAEAFLTLAEALDQQDTERVALIHARLAAFIRPGEIEADLLAAELLAGEGQFALATKVLADVPPDSPWFVTSEIRRANTQRAAGDLAGGIETLKALSASHPDQIEVKSALGDAYRADDRFDEAVLSYDAAIALVDTPQHVHWALYYTRGVANERSGHWDAAEADLRQALALEPRQAQVLNYLGYSMLEHGENYDEALDMIQRAVRLEPEDGYITDSLGWAYYRLGRYDEAVAPMLRAVELVPEDPVINDHLGDVLWKVGRTREADFQWHRALSFGPADDLDMDLIRQKLDVGLEKAQAKEKEKSDG